MMITDYDVSWFLKLMIDVDSDDDDDDDDSISC